MNKKKIETLMKVMYNVGFEIDEINVNDNFTYLYFYNNYDELVMVGYCSITKHYSLTFEFENEIKHYSSKQCKRIINYIQKNI